MTQNATQSLSAQQERAVELILGGMTVTAVAASIGVSRETVHRWQRENFPFIAAVNRAKRELSEAASVRLLAAWNKAAENVAKAVEDGDLKASFLVLRGFAGPFGIAHPIGSDDPDKLGADWEQAQREARLQRLLSAG
jgi:post-segregation antitoxin (ccd killing protein)